MLSLRLGVAKCENAAAKVLDNVPPYVISAQSTTAGTKSLVKGCLLWENDDLIGVWLSNRSQEGPPDGKIDEFAAAK